ncbi:hypothetical protein AYI69_g4945 [Smittium culicis]|uniref:Uncharacterized protein n=1 Tax=Smittium culicis TaxID=133412 RepID=A0A1R1Y9A5_9FUNG|nr:hypothetical protein AYI69_g6994 [Smittium culicis]OMJ23509.1 hypothetical protein AYI69_g4945 [Smittium culicis]
MQLLPKRGTDRPRSPTLSWYTAKIRIAVDRRTCAQRLSQTVLNESVPSVSRWFSSGIAVLRIADRCLHFPQRRIVQSYVKFWYSALRKVHYLIP